MNRTDRLLAIVLELQRRRRSYCRAEDLAAQFEVSKRTIYRDIQALCEAGVPITVAERQGYALVEGYFLPPLSFTTDEALILALGSDVMANNFDHDYRTVAHSAYRKIDAVLPAPLRSQVDHLKNKLQFAMSHRLDDTQLTMLQALRQAVVERKRIRLYYIKHENDSDAPVQMIREVDPYHLTRLTNDWHLTGYCYLRRAVRVFRLARIEHIIVLDLPCEHSEDEITEPDNRDRSQPFFVQVVFDRTVARLARETNQYALLEQDETPEGIQITFLAQSDHGMVRWLLGWGSNVRVVEPPWLQALLIRHAGQMLRNYSSIPQDG